ncbi:MAG: hypothetical protein H7840_11515 [Alphaproteobacteria bacterium]
MRLVFVNQCHPETPHVCATRLREFAQAMARRGHQVVLLTEPLAGGADETVRPEALAEALSRHDWGRPFRLVTTPTASPLLVAAREGRVPAPLRKAVIAGTYCLRGGVRTDWRDGSRPFWGALARSFRPEVAWGTFGNTDTWAITQGVARAAGCPWVMDLKDPWGIFVPAPLRHRLARRFADAAAATVFSRQHAADTARYFDIETTVVYSGIGPEFLSPPDAATPEDIFTLVGGVYDGAALRDLVSGLRSWLENDPPSKRITLAYAGADRGAVAAACEPLRSLCRLDLRDYLPLAELRRRLTASRLVLYVRSPSSLFQHKLFELLATGRPILCLPTESDEARDIANAVAGAVGDALYDCASAAEVPAAVERALSSSPTVDRAALGRYGWDAQGDILAQVLDRARTKGGKR